MKFDLNLKKKKKNFRCYDDYDSLEKLETIDKFFVFCCCCKKKIHILICILKNKLIITFKTMKKKSPYEDNRGTKFILLILNYT